MLVTDLAYRDMEVRADGMFDRLDQFARWLLRRPASTVSAPGFRFPFAAGHQAHVQVMPRLRENHRGPEPIRLETSDTFRWRRHPQLLNQSRTGASADVEDLERSARSAGVRGLFLARSGRIDEARAAFAIAAGESSVDLSVIPGFWDLSRSGMLAAVSAYDDVERYRDASALGARIRLTYRPRSVSAVPEVPNQRRSVAGS